MPYKITLEIPDGEWCLKITDPYILCPLMVCYGDEYLCPLSPDVEPLPELLGHSDISKGGVVKQPFCPSRKPVKDGEIDFWTYQKLREVRKG